ncbi:MAG: hypothetical protein HZA02_09620 [Nitrospinae bacterium]|nr:hypothetical protein [Nitrospinota bacterium]
MQNSVPMNPQLQFLIALQETDSEIANWEKGLALVPVQIESAKSDLAARRKKLDDADARIKEVQNRSRQLEQEVKIENDHMSKTKLKLPSVKTNKEYTAILAEVETIERKITGLEDRELELMETLESREKELPGSKAEYQEEEKKFNQYKSRKEAEKSRLEKDLEAARRKRDELVRSTDPKLVQRYEKVLKLRGDHAVARLVGHICQGCFQQILPQLVIEIRSGEKVFECIHCNRFLYWVPEPVTETAAPK